MAEIICAFLEKAASGTEIHSGTSYVTISLTIRALDPLKKISEAEVS